jgi:hypothetical protein
VERHKRLSWQSTVGNMNPFSSRTTDGCRIGLTGGNASAIWQRVEPDHHDGAGPVPAGAIGGNAPTASSIVG